MIWRLENSLAEVSQKLNTLIPLDTQYHIVAEQKKLIWRRLNGLYLANASFLKKKQTFDDALLNSKIRSLEKEKREVVKEIKQKRGGEKVVFPSKNRSDEKKKPTALTKRIKMINEFKRIPFIDRTKRNITYDDDAPSNNIPSQEIDYKDNTVGNSDIQDMYLDDYISYSEEALSSNFDDFDDGRQPWEREWERPLYIK